MWLVTFNLSKNALFPLSLSLSCHFGEHLILVETKFIGKFLNQQDISISLCSFTRVVPVKLHHQHLLLEFGGEQTLHLIGELETVICIYDVTNAQVMVFCDWKKLVFHLDIACE